MCFGKGRPRKPGELRSDAQPPDEANVLFYRVRRRVVNLIKGLPGGRWLLAWGDPLHVARRTLRKAVESHAELAHGRLVDVGCGWQPYRDLFGQVEYYVGMDLPDIPGVDVCGDATRLPFGDASVETVLCNEVLEHVPQPTKVMTEIARILRPGGVLLLTAPQTWGLHHEPHDFYRYTKYGLSYLAQESGLSVVHVIPTCGVWATLSQRLADTVVHTMLVDAGPRTIGWVSKLFAPLLMMGSALDRIFGFRGDTLDHLLVARKP